MTELSDLTRLRDVAIGDAQTVNPVLESLMNRALACIVQMKDWDDDRKEFEAFIVGIQDKVEILEAYCQMLGDRLIKMIPVYREQEMRNMQLVLQEQIRRQGNPPLIQPGRRISPPPFAPWSTYVSAESLWDRLHAAKVNPPLTEQDNP